MWKKIFEKTPWIVVLAVCLETHLLLGQGGPAANYGNCDNPVNKANLKCKSSEGPCQKVTLGKCNTLTISCPGNNAFGEKSSKATEFRAFGTCATPSCGSNCPLCKKYWCIKGKLYDSEDCAGAECAVSYYAGNKCDGT